MYSPLNVNATLHCAVNNTNLFWEVDGLALDSPVQGRLLHSRGIFQHGQSTSSNGVTESTVLVLGNQHSNNNVRICCQSVIVNRLYEICTILIVYGKIIIFMCY